MPVRIIHQVEDKGKRQCWLLEGIGKGQGARLARAGWEWTPGPDGGCWTTDDRTVAVEAIGTGIPTVTHYLCPVQLLANPQSREVFAYARNEDTITGVDGDVYGITASEAAGWENVTTCWLESTVDWLQNPGLYGPPYVRAEITVARGRDSHVFTAGGNIVTIIGWCRTYGATHRLMDCWTTRDEARRSAEVEW